MRREPSEPEPVPLILSFHQVHTELSFGVTNYAPKRFFHLLAFLIDRGYALTSLESVLTEPHPKRVAICFDDGYQHLLDILPRAMEEYSLRPTVFVPTAYVGRSNSWDYSHRFRPLQHLHEGEVRQLAQGGVTIGSHGHSHISLRDLSDEDLERELVRSKRGLEELTGTSVNLISYPFGRVDRRVMAAAHKAGYRYGFTMAHPYSDDDPLAVGRIAVYAFDTPFSILKRLTPGPLAVVERIKGKIINGLAGGTILLDRLRHMRMSRRG